MTATTREGDIIEVGSVLQRLLHGMGLVGFTFDTSFRLRFSGEASEGRPSELELVLESDWRLGSAEEWRATVARLAPVKSLSLCKTDSR